MCGLEWEDIDLDARVVTIKRAMTYVNGHVYLGATKTEQSERSIPLSETLAGILSAFRDWQRAQQAAAGKYIRQNIFDGMEYNFAFVWQNGGYVHPLWWTRQMPKIMVRAGLEKHIRWHDLRHPYGKHTTKKYDCEKQKSQATKK